MMPRLSGFAPAVFAGMVMLPLPVAAQSVDFGDDSSIWAMDGECDDPRFMGEGMAPDPLEGDMFADASDCAAAFEAGTISLDPAMADAKVPSGQPAKPGTEVADDTVEIDFGSDTSQWANDGECDDPRFAGAGMSPQPQDSDIMADATDCRTLYESYSIEFIGAGTDEPDLPAAVDIDFGADTSDWANDGECDDPRFAGQGMASQPQESDMFADATDCRTLFDAGSIQLVAEGRDTDMVHDTGNVDFGADTGRWVNDGECDDPRFEGEGMAEVLVEEDLFADATDCRTLYEAGMIQLVGEATKTTDIDFGTDSGKWAGDGECDDPRFNGQGMSAMPLDALRFLDATDCRSLYEAGQLSYLGE